MSPRRDPFTRSRLSCYARLGRTSVSCNLGDVTSRCSLTSFVPYHLPVYEQCFLLSLLTVCGGCTVPPPPDTPWGPWSAPPPDTRDASRLQRHPEHSLTTLVHTSRVTSGSYKRAVLKATAGGHGHRRSRFGEVSGTVPQGPKLVLLPRSWTPPRLPRGPLVRTGPPRLWDVPSPRGGVRAAQGLSFPWGPEAQLTSWAPLAGPETAPRGGRGAEPGSLRAPGRTVAVSPSFSLFG